MLRKGLSILAVLTLAFAGCGGEEETPEGPASVQIGDAQQTQNDPEALFQEWHELAQDEATFTSMRSKEIALALFAMGGDEHLMILEVLEDPESSPTEKISAGTSLQMMMTDPMMSADIEDRLVALLDETESDTTRAVVLQMLSAARNEELRPVLREHLDSDDVRVQLAAAGGLAMLGDEAAWNTLVELYRSSELDRAQRSRAVFNLSQAAQIKNWSVLEEAVADASLRQDTRMIVARVLAARGGEEQRQVLEDMLKDSAVLEAPIRQSIEQALEAAKQQSGGEQSDQMQIDVQPVTPEGEATPGDAAAVEPKPEALVVEPDAEPDADATAAEPVEPGDEGNAEAPAEDETVEEEEPAAAE